MLDLYSQFDKEVMPGILEFLLGSDTADRLEPSSSDSVMSGAESGSLSRLSVLVTADQLHLLVEWLRAVGDRRAAGEEVVKELESLTGALPTAVPGIRSKKKKIYLTFKYVKIIFQMRWWF